MARTLRWQCAQDRSRPKPDALTATSREAVILLCVWWYWAYNLSLRDLEEMMAERGISIDHATVL